MHDLVWLDVCGTGGHNHSAVRLTRKMAAGESRPTAIPGSFDMRPLHRAMQSRASAYLRSKSPMRVFSRRLFLPGKILDVVEASALPSNAKREARRHYIVCLAAAFESFWREFIRDSVDASTITPKRLTHLRKLSFTIAEVHEIAMRRVSLGELLAGAYSVRSPDQVNQTFSELLQIDVFAQFRKSRYKMIEVLRANAAAGSVPSETFVDSAFILRKISVINRLLAIRNDTVHDTGGRHRLGEKDRFKYDSAVFTFNSFLALFLEGRIAMAWPHS